MADDDMIDPVLNEPRHPWYQKRNHVRIPKRAESKKYLDAFYVGGGTPPPAGLPVCTVNPSVTTTGIIGSNAVGTYGTWTDADTFASIYQHYDGALSEWVDIAGSTSLTWAIAAAQNAQNCRLKVTATNEAGSVEAYSSEFFVKYAAPVITAAGTLTGLGTVGSIITLTGNTYTGEAVTFAYDWKLGGVSLGEVSDISLLLTSAHIGNLTCTWYASNSGGSASATTPARAITYPVPVWDANQAWNESQGTGVQTFDLEPLLLVGTGAVVSIFSGGSGITLTGLILSVSTAAAVVNQAIVVRATSTPGGSDDITITLNVAASAATKIRIDFQNLSRLWTTTGRTVNSSVNGPVAYVDNIDTPGNYDLSFTNGTATLRQHANGSYYLEFATDTRFTFTNSLAFARNLPGAASIVACKPTDLVGEAVLAQFTRGTLNSSMLDIRHVNGVPRASARRQFSESSSTDSLWGASVTTDQVIAAVVDWTAGTITVRVNGVYGTAGTLPTTGNSQDSDGLGGQGANNTLLTQDMTGNIYGMVLFRGIATLTEIQNAEADLAALYAATFAPVENTDFVVTDAQAKSGDTLTVAVSTFPAGATGFYYKLATESVWVTSGLSAAGNFNITGLARETANTFNCRWKYGSTDGPASANVVKTPTFSTLCRFVSTTGSDSAAGTWAAPWRNPNKFNALTAGMVGYLLPGTWSGATACINGVNSGSSSPAVSVVAGERPTNPITVTTLPEHRFLATLDGTGSSSRGIIELRAKNYWIISNIRLINAGDDAIYVEGTSGQENGHHIFEYLQIDTCGNAGLFVCGLVMGSTIPVNTWRTIDILIQRCDITKTNDPDGGNECVSIGGGVRDALVRWNHIHDSRQYGIDFKLGVKNGEAYGNYVHHMLKHGLYSDCACRTNENILFHDNWVERCGEQAGAGNGICFARECARGALGTGGQNNQGYYHNLINNKAWNNIFVVSGNFGLLLSKHSSDISMLILNIDGATATSFTIGKQVTGGTSGAKRSIAGAVWSSATVADLYLVQYAGSDNAIAFQNNEAITCTGGAALVNGTGVTGMPGKYEVEFTHNTIWESTGNPIKADVLTACAGRNILIANTIAYDTGGGTMINDAGPSTTKVNNITANPLFTDPHENGGDFTIQAGSPANGGGSATWRIPSDYSGYVPVAGVPWNCDFVPRTPVTRAATPDCGALERL